MRTPAIDWIGSSMIAATVSSASLAHGFYVAKLGLQMTWHIRLDPVRDTFREKWR